MMQLSRPLVFFDLETTGVNVTNDRIVEIALLKVFPDKTKEEKHLLVNPEMEIPKETVEIHGISNEDVKNAPTFKEVSKEILDFLGDSDLAGYNSNKFDIPLLVKEFERINVEFEYQNRKFVDVQVIYHKNEPRDLSAAYQFYCKKKLENAHSAIHDTKATYEILCSQIEKYDNLQNDVSFLSAYSTNKGAVDLGGRLGKTSEGQFIFRFGKHKGKQLTEIFEKEPQYYNWMMKNDFHPDTKKVLKTVWEKYQFEKSIKKLKQKF